MLIAEFGKHIPIWLKQEASMEVLSRLPFFT
jgi:hypothetical protein